MSSEPGEQVRHNAGELGAALRRCRVGRHRVDQRLRQLHPGDLAGQPPAYERSELPVARSRHRQVGQAWHRLVTVGVAHRRREQCGLALRIAVQRALGQAERVGHILHLRALIAVGDERSRRGGDNRREPVGRDCACHGHTL